MFSVSDDHELLISIFGSPRYLWTPQFSHSTSNLYFGYNEPTTLHHTGIIKMSPLSISYFVVSLLSTPCHFHLKDQSRPRSGFAQSSWVYVSWMYYLNIAWSLNHLFPMHHFSTSRKHRKTERFFDVFRG